MLLILFMANVLCSNMSSLSIPDCTFILYITGCRCWICHCIHLWYSSFSPGLHLPISLIYFQCLFYAFQPPGPWESLLAFSLFSWISYISCGNLSPMYMAKPPQSVLIFLKLNSFSDYLVPPILILSLLIFPIIVF